MIGDNSYIGYLMSRVVNFFSKPKKKCEKESVHKEKAYCKKCKWLEFRGSKNRCVHLNNLENVDYWDGQRMEYKDSPKWINRQNDCKWFEAKENE